MNMGTDRVLIGLRCSPKHTARKMDGLCVCTHGRYREMMREKRTRTSLLCGRSIHKTLFTVKDSALCTVL